MSNIDEFESLFRRAEREPFAYRPLDVRTVAVLTDRDEAYGREVAGAVKTMLPDLASAKFVTLGRESLGSVAGIEKAVETCRPDLLVTFRLLTEPESVSQHSLGRYLDVLTQTLPPPCLVMAGTAADPALPSAAADSCVVLTDHIRGDSRLVSTAAALMPEHAALHLCHVEDDAVFERYIGAIEQVPGLDSDLARREIEAVLLGEARDYIQAAEAGLAEAGEAHPTHAHVVRGHRLETFRGLIEAHDADLVVLNTKDEGQLAMHGMAYAVAVEVTGRPLLML